MKTFLAPFFAVVLCLLMAGCSSKNPIIGKWQGDGGQFEFTQDGKLLLNAGSVSINGTYTLPDDGHFKMEMDIAGNKQSKTIAYTVSGDTLTTDDNGKKDTLKRIK